MSRNRQATRCRASTYRGFASRYPIIDTRCAYADGQVIVVTTHRRAGCPDLASILKQLQEAAANSD